MKNENSNYIIRYSLISVMAISIFSLLIVYNNQYNAEAHMAKALPIAILAGLSTLAVAIYERNKK
ncbi:hypothetical protein LGQ02_02795 [Bacillus shivajii]|uniref:hypothetical protein n=1 Tax=Bacillus shivajii TaxID=1983719 RepID=UPI001CFA7054|nr:hypothetical protein [Bacillus shivajii]UCZ51471.1 hypothetical protein LGQ02_11340 [Bacillus shivajii]UCZ53732.1 hypothetical protein LGQ02_02795 [Bacillus shivajii]